MCIKTSKSLIVLAVMIMYITACQSPPAQNPTIDFQVTDISDNEIVTNDIKQIKTFDQCTSSGNLKTEVQFSDSSTRTDQQQLVLGAEITGGGEISGVAKIELKGSIEKHFSQSIQQGQGHVESASIEVPSHTQQEYIITWRETRRAGTVEYVENGETKAANYSYRIGLELVSVSGRDITCPGQATIIPPTSLPPDSPPTVTPHFSEVRFCLENEFNVDARSCDISRNEFPRQVDKIYVSWSYSNVYPGMTFSRKWYQNNQLIREVNNAVWDGSDWRIDGLSEYTWLAAVVFNQNYFPPGFYTFELYIGNVLEQAGSFTVVD